MYISPENIRSRYPDGDYVVAGKSVSVNQIKVRSMNFGQHWRGEEAESIPYEIKLPLPLALDIINWQLPAYVEDSRLYPDEQSLLERLLKESGWITDARQIFDSGNELLKQMLLEEYAHEMILQWFGDGNLPGKGFVLNSCNEVGLKGDEVIIKGYCRSTETSIAYQDF